MSADFSIQNSIKILISTIIFLIFLYLFKETENNFILSEKGIIENLTAVFYIFAVYFSYKLFKLKCGKEKYFFGLWLFLCFIFLGEETSWFQHYLGYDTPEKIAVLNAQQEFNLHNITTSNGSLTDAISKNKFQFSILLKSQNLFNIGFGIYFLIIPLLARFGKKTKQLISKLSIPTIGSNLMVSLWIPIVFTVAIGFTDPNKETHIRAYMGEGREMLFALTILLFLYVHYKDNNK